MRVLQIPVVLALASLFTFILIQVVPGNPGRNALGPFASTEQVAAWNKSHGLSGTPLERYLDWMGGLLTGDWGESIVYGVPVFELVLTRLGNSIVLAVLAIAILVPVALTIAILHARVDGSPADRGFTIALMSLASIPEFVLGVLLIVVFAIMLPIFPIRSGGALDGLAHWRALMLPAMTIALGSLAVVARMARSAIVEATRSQFYRTAMNKGLGEGAVLRRHVARNAAIPVVAVLGTYLGALLGGSALVETLFSYPGLGELLVTATQRKDILVLGAGVMVTGAVSMLVLLVADVAFAIIDPRIRFTRRSR